MDDPWSIIPSRWNFNTPFLQPVCKPPLEKNFRPLYLPPKPGFYFKYATNTQPKQQQQQQHQHQQQPETLDNDGARQATVLDYGTFKQVPSILCGHNDNFIKTAYHVEGDAMIHAMSKRISEEHSTAISQYLDRKYGQVKSDPDNGNWDVFYRRYLHEQIQHSGDYIDDLVFGGVQGKAYLISVWKFIQEALSDGHVSPNDPRSHRLLQYARSRYFEEVSEHFKTLEKVHDCIKRNDLGDIQSSYNYYNDIRPRELRSLAFKAYLRSPSAKVDSHTLLFDESIRELNKLRYEEIHGRPEADPAGVLDYLKGMADKVNEHAAERAINKEDGVRMELDDNYSDNGEEDGDVFKVVAPPIPKPVTNKRSKRASRSSTAKKQQIQQMHVNESPESENARLSLLKVALKLPSTHLSSS